MDASTMTICGVSAVFIVGIIVNLIKGTGKVPSAYLPIISQFVGIGVGCVWAYTTGNGYIMGVVAGMVLGAAVSGNYDVLTGIKSNSSKVDVK